MCHCVRILTQKSGVFSCRLIAVCFLLSFRFIHAVRSPVKMESSGHKETLGEEKALPPKKRCKFDASRPGCESASVSAQDLVFGSHDLTGLVLRFLPAKDKLLAGRCLTVSRQWRDLCRSNIVWHSIGQEDCKFLSRKTGTDDEEESGDDGSGTYFRELCCAFTITGSILKSPFIRCI